MNLFGGISFNPDEDIPDLSGKVVFVTGGNIGLGKETCLRIAKHNPKHIYLAARNAQKAADAIADIKSDSPEATISFLECDLASLDSVQKAAKDFNAQSPRLDLLFLNAGIMAAPPGMTKDGYELQFGTNHVGHALLVKLLMPTLIKTAKEPKADVRIVALSSMGHQWPATGGIDFKGLRSEQKEYSTWSKYGQSKLANILFAKELARRYPQIKTVAVHPGSVNTNLTASLTDNSAIYNVLKTVLLKFPLSSYFISTPAQGARNQLWAATANTSEVVSGEYYTPVAVTGGGSRYSNDKKLASELWDWTQKELEHFAA